jgi:hypothetical protein
LFESLDTPAEVWTAFFLTAALTGLMTAGGGFMIWKIVDYFRTWVIWWDEDAGRTTIERRKVKEATLYRGKGDKGRAYFLNARARKTANKGSAYFIDVHSGMNMVGPSRDETLTLLEAAVVQLPNGLQRELEDLEEKDPEAAKHKRREYVAGTIAKLKACDPFFSFNQLTTNSYKKWNKTQDEKPDWKTTVAPFALGAVIVLAVALMWLANVYTKSQA